MTELRRTPLYDLHIALGAKMVPFAGYEMPVQYPMGVMGEHNHTRARAGLFDVSHMGQVILRAPAQALEALVPVDVQGLAPWRQRYALFTNEAGGILDDLMIANRGDHLFLVVNAACKDADIAHLRAHLPGVEPISDRALIALQGPEAEQALARLVPGVAAIDTGRRRVREAYARAAAARADALDRRFREAGVAAMRFMDVGVLDWDGVALWISRSGYTGEDGFEISVPDAQAEALCRALLAMPEVAPIGLGARDSLRLEAGLCLYGHDIDTTTSPIEAALGWAIQKRRRIEGGFPGAARIQRELQAGPPRKRVGLTLDGKAPAREGAREGAPGARGAFLARGADDVERARPDSLSR